MEVTSDGTHTFTFIQTSINIFCMHRLLTPAGMGNYFLIRRLAASWPSAATSLRSAWCVITHVGNFGLDLGIDNANKGKHYRHLVAIAVMKKF